MNYYILCYENDGTLSYVARNRTTIKDVRHDLLAYLYDTISPIKYAEYESWSFGRLLYELRLGLYKSNTLFDTVNVQFGKRKWQSLEAVFPDVEVDLIRQYTNGVLNE